MNKLITAGLVAGMTVAVSACTITDITSSTSSTLDAVTPDVTLNRFVDIRMASIQKEAAAGKGENLDALAQLMGEADKAEFSNMMHVNYEKLFDNLTEPAELVSRIEALQTEKAI